MRKRQRRIIEQLRALYPGRWSYNGRSAGWEHEDGWSVRAEAHLAPRFDGDDDSFVTHYRRSDTGEEVPELLEPLKIWSGS